MQKEKKEIACFSGGREKLKENEKLGSRGSAENFPPLRVDLSKKNGKPERGRGRRRFQPTSRSIFLVLMRGFPARRSEPMPGNRKQIGQQFGRDEIPLGKADIPGLKRRRPGAQLS